MEELNASEESPGATAHRVQWTERWTGRLPSPWEGETAIIRETTSGGLISYQEDQQRAAPHCPCDKLGPGATRQVSPERKV